MTDFFDSDFQENFKKNQWGDWSSKIDDQVVGNFSSYFSTVECKSKSRNLSVGDFLLADHISWTFPENVEILNIDITIQKIKDNQKVVEGIETGLYLYSPLEELNSLNVKNLYGNTTSISKKMIKNGIQLNFEKSKHVSSKNKMKHFSLSARKFFDGSDELANIGLPDNYHAFHENSNIGWGAIDGKVIDSHTLEIYATDMLYKENIDFRNLVCTFKFSESLYDCKVGYIDIPNYFGKQTKEE